MIEKHFVDKKNPVSVIFDPIPSYWGEWFFGLENLRKNAKVENKVNLWDEFHRRTYIEPLTKIFKNSSIINIPVGMVSKPNDNNIGRCLRYSRSDFFVGLTGFLLESIDNHGLSNEENEKRINDLIQNILLDNETLNLAYADALNEKARRLKDVIDKEFNSEYFEAAMQDYAPYKDTMGFSDYVKKAYAITKDIQVGLLKLGDFFDRNVPYNELYEAFEPDKFFLLFAKIIYEFNLMRESEDNILDHNYNYLIHYYTALSEVIKENKKYDSKILYTLNNGKKIRYSRWQFREEFEALADRHPEVSAIKLPDLEIDGGSLERYKDIDLMSKLTQLYSEETSVNWEFLPEGEGIKRWDGTGTVRNVEAEKKDKDTLRAEVNMRIAILENSGFIGRPIKGLNTFNGYYAYVYPNGKVILEKFWDNEDTLNPATNAATYVMNIDNFVEMSKLSRISLVEYIKTFPNNGVKRIFHTTINHWHRNLYNEINGTYRLDDAIEFIRGLQNGEGRNGN